MDKIQVTGFADLSSNELQVTEGGATLDQGVVRLVSGALEVMRGKAIIASRLFEMVRDFRASRS